MSVATARAIPTRSERLFRTSRSCRSRTCQPGFVDPALGIRETTHSTPRQSRTGPPAFGGPALESARQGSVNRQGVRGELNPPPRPSQGRMLACYTTNTINRAVTREGLEPSRRGGHGLLRAACLPFHHLAIREQWTVEGVEPSFAGCKPTVFPLDDTPINRPVAPQGVEP